MLDHSIVLLQCDFSNRFLADTDMKSYVLQLLSSSAKCLQLSKECIAGNTVKSHCCNAAIGLDGDLSLNSLFYFIIHC